MSEIQKAIQEQIAKRRLNILKGIISANGDNEEDKTEYESVSEAEGELFNDQASTSINKVSNDGYEEIKKAQTIILEASVGIVVNDFGQILLGLAISDDERNGNWCFPGGGIDDGENSLNAAIREVYEEMGMVCVGKDHYRMYKIKCSSCGKNFWKHENKAEGEKTKWTRQKVSGIRHR
jgi:hypothetical protein